MLNNQNQAYTKKKATNSTKTTHPSIGKKDHPAYQLSNNLSNLNDSFGFSTIKDNESLDVKQVTLKDKETEDRVKAKTNDEYNMLFWNNYEGINKPALIGKKVTMKGNYVASDEGSSGLENNKLDPLIQKKEKEKEHHLLFPFNSFNNQNPSSDPKQEDMLNYYLNYTKNNTEKADSNSNANSNSNRNSIHNSRRDCFVNNKKSNTNSNTFSFKNFLSHQLKPLAEDSKGDNSNINIDENNNSNIQILPSKYSKRDNYGTKLRETVVNEIVEEDDLTPLPIRKEKIHPIAEYEFNQARSAAVLIRRIEYSYHLKSTRQYKKYERQIIYIQRWWKTVFENRNANILRDLIEYELRSSNYFPQEDIMRNYTDFTLIINRITDRNRMRKAFECLYDNFADLAWYNQTCESVDMIIRAFRKHKAKLKQKALRRFKYLICYLYRKLYIKKITQGKDTFEKDIDKITKIQAAIAGYLFRKCDKVVTEIGRNYHPFLYYKIKYGNDDKLCKNKISTFIKMVNKWKERIIERKLKRAAAMTERLNKFFFRYYFDYLLTQIIKKTNSIITIILLKPHRDFLLRVLYTSSLQRFFIHWKRDYLDKKRKCILGKKIVHRILAVKVFRPLVKKYKRKSRLIALIKTITHLFEKKVNNNKMIKFKVFQSYYFKALSKTKHITLLRKLMSYKGQKNLKHYFTFLRIVSMNNAKNIFMIKYGLSEISKAIRNILINQYQKEKEVLRIKKLRSIPSFANLLAFFSYSKSLFWLKKLILNLPMKLLLKYSLTKWRRCIVLILKSKDNKLRNVVMIYDRQIKRSMTKYLFRYLRKTPIHPNQISLNITTGIQMINTIFNKKYTYHLYAKLRKGSFRLCLALLMKIIIEIVKEKILLHKASFINALLLNKQLQTNKRCKSYQIVSMRSKDECKLLLQYFNKWIKSTIKDQYQDRETKMNKNQSEKLKQLCIKRIILHQTSLLLRLALMRWNNRAEAKTHRLTMRRVMKKKNMKIILSNKQSKDDKALRRLWFRWRQACSDYIKDELNTIQGSNMLLKLYRNKAMVVLIEALRNKYFKDKQSVMRNVVNTKIAKEHNMRGVLFMKWRYIKQYETLITSTSVIQEQLRRKNRMIKGTYLSKAIKHIFNKKALSYVKANVFNTIVSRFILKKEVLILKKPFIHWLLLSLMVRYSHGRSLSNTIKNTTVTVNCDKPNASNSILRKYVIEIENQSEHVYQYKALEYQVHTESVQFQGIREGDEIIEITHLLKHRIQLKQYYQMKIATSKKRSTFMYWRHLESLPIMKQRIISYISSTITNEKEIIRLNYLKWLKQSKMLALISAAKCIQRQYSLYKLIKSSKAKLIQSSNDNSDNQ